MSRPMVTYKSSDEVDFVIIGSGAAGGVLAKELSTNGFRVVVLEQGEYLREKDFTHDETKIFIQSLLTNKVNTHPITFRKSSDETARRPCRLHELRLLPRFRMRSRRKVHYALQRDSHGRKNRPLRDPPQLLRQSH